ncbi:MAG: tRNA (adenosine(37)-N6)-threonylcarbamoyltransferase complex ATPase subunit type 1 TsaE [Bacteroidales bacterium]|nr:tRNA (adenosine(37)-N6)-threonylcarbamoyltransferase complex ATPase subunit type 1 TsaE [Bacteroidales bacterium]
MEIKIAGLEQLHDAAKTFAQHIGENTLFAFRGNMGAGKTTFIKALCEVLGVEDDTVNSPTFSIVNEYNTKHHTTIYHFDFYRLKHYSEAIDFGIFDYFNSGNLCLMEWPENIEELLPDDTVVVIINVNDDGTRTITI